MEKLQSDDSENTWYQKMFQLYFHTDCNNSVSNYNALDNSSIQYIKFPSGRVLVVPVCWFIYIVLNPSTVEQEAILSSPWPLHRHRISVLGTKTVSKIPSKRKNNRGLVYRAKK